MDNERFWAEFIELYRQHPCLWDVKSNEYLNKHKRNASYDVLLNKIKQIKSDANLEFVKKKINNMRTAFRRELKKVQDSKRTGSGRDDVYEPSLWYYDLMLFTAQSESGRKGLSTDEREDEVVDNTDDTIETEIDEQTDESRISILSPRRESGTHTVELNEATPSASRSSSEVTNRYKKRAAPRKYTSETKKLELMELAHNTLSTEEDEYLIAGKRIGYQLIGVDEQQRIIAEKLISDVMYYARMGKLTEDAFVQCKSSNVNNFTERQLPDLHNLSQSTSINPRNSQHQSQSINTIQLQTLPMPAPSQYSSYQSSQSGSEEHFVFNSSEDAITTIRNYYKTYQPQDI